MEIHKCPFYFAKYDTNTPIPQNQLTDQLNEQLNEPPLKPDLTRYLIYLNSLIFTKYFLHLYNFTINP